MKKRYLIVGGYATAGAALGLKLWLRPRDVRWGEHKNSLHHAEHSRFADVDGVQVHYQEAGEKSAPPLLLIHGFCASTFVWRDVFLLLADAGFRVIVPDLIGFGFSEKPKNGRWGEYTIDAQRRMIIGLLDELNIAKATLVGSSYGGAVAMFCALDAPERVAKLVLVSPVTNDDVPKQTLLRMAAAPVLGDLLSPLMMSSPRLMRWRMQKVYAAGNEALQAKERLQAHQLPLLAANTQRAFLRTLRRWDATRIEREADRITHETLLIWGEDDRDVHLRHGYNLATKLLHNRLIVFRDCGHLPQEEHPQEFTKLAAEFCYGQEK